MLLRQSVERRSQCRIRTIGVTGRIVHEDPMPAITSERHEFVLRAVVGPFVRQRCE
jgi:hypothetical protein